VPLPICAGRRGGPGRSDEGLRFYQEAYQASLENPAAEKKEEYKKALDKFKESMAIYSWGNGSDDRIFIGNSHTALKEFDQAQAAYSKVWMDPSGPSP